MARCASRAAVLVAESSLRSPHRSPERVSRSLRRDGAAPITPPPRLETR